MQPALREMVEIVDNRNVLETPIAILLIVEKKRKIWSRSRINQPFVFIINYG